MHLLKLAKLKFSTYKYMSYDKNQLTVTGIFRFVTITGTGTVMIIMMMMMMIIYFKNLGKKDKNI